ncbi:MAG: hypothetical protein ACOY41_07645 [Pseudomonadota bacterium]
MKAVNSLGLVLAAGLALGLAAPALAAGTAAGTVISNTVSVDYEVGGINQPDVTSLPTTFVVDRMVNVTVANLGGAVNVVPNSQDQWIAFTVQNDSNSPLDFRLVAANLAGDDFDAGGLSVFVEDGTNPGTYDPTEDMATFLDELAPGTPVTVYVVGDIPVGATNTQDANITLTAIAAEQTLAVTGAYDPTPGVLAADAVATNTATADDSSFIDTVFADAAGVTGDVAYDGRHSDDGQFNVATAALAVTKSSRVVSDPFNGTTNPKGIPGAVVEYCLDVNNGGSSAADNIVLTDAIPTNTTYVAGSIRIGATGTAAACDLGTGTLQTDAAAGGDDDAEFDATGNGTVTIRASSVASGSRFKAVFRVTVD